MFLLLFGVFPSPLIRSPFLIVYVDTIYCYCISIFINFEEPSAWILLQVGRPENIVFFFGQHFSRDYCPPGHQNPAMHGLLLGCRSPLIDAGHEKNFFYALFLLKTVKTSSGGRARHRNRSSVVELVGREPWIIARVENGVTKVSPHRQ